MSVVTDENLADTVTWGMYHEGLYVANDMDYDYFNESAIGSQNNNLCDKWG